MTSQRISMDLPSDPRRWPATQWLLAAIIVLAPFVMGGRQPTGRVILIAAIGLLATVWSWSRRHGGPRWQSGPLLPLWLLGIALLAMQLAPLTPTLRSQLSPYIDANLPFWNSSESAEMGLGTWQTLSLTPTETLRGLILLIAYGLLFLVVLQQLRTWNDLRQMVAIIGGAGVLMAVIALAQRFGGNGKFLWVYEHPYRHANDVVKGPFTNENHLCGFLALTIPALLYFWQFTSTSRSDRASNGFGGRVERNSTSSYWLGAVAALLVAALLTFSRGGILAIGVATLATVALLSWGGLKRENIRGLAGVGLALVVVLGVYGADPLSRQLKTISTDVSKMSSARAALWTAVGEAIPNYAWCGAGVGAHRHVYPQYMSMQLDVELTHAENGYLQVLLETGVLGLLLLLVGWLLLLKAAWKVFRKAEHSEQRGIGAVVLAASAASLFHSLGDFVWYIPACMTLMVVLAAVGFRAQSLVDAEERAASQSDVPTRHDGKFLASNRWMGATLACGLAACWMVAISLPPAMAGIHWDRYLKLSLEARKRPGSLADITLLKTLVGHLEAAVSADPHRPRPQLRLATMKLKLFEQQQAESENPMPLSQLREAAAASRDAFGTIEKQREWLVRAVGDNLKNAESARRHALETLRLCPLQGEAYVLIAELEMLDSLEDRRPILLQQALKLRPFSGSVLFAVGSHFALQGDQTRAVRFWRAAFHRQRDVRRVLLTTLAPQLPAQQLLDEIRPTTEMLSEVRFAYVQAKRPEDAAVVALYMAKFAERDARNGQRNRWKDALQSWRWAGDEARAALCGLEAVKIDPGSYQVRKQLGLSLKAAGQLEAATPHLAWCRQRKPHDTDVALAPIVRR